MRSSAPLPRLLEQTGRRQHAARVGRGDTQRAAAVPWHHRAGDRGAAVHVGGEGAVHPAAGVEPAAEALERDRVRDLQPVEGERDRPPLPAAAAELGAAHVDGAAGHGDRGAAPLAAAGQGDGAVEPSADLHPVEPRGRHAAAFGQGQAARGGQPGRVDRQTVDARRFAEGALHRELAARGAGQRPVERRDAQADTREIRAQPEVGRLALLQVQRDPRAALPLQAARRHADPELVDEPLGELDPAVDPGRAVALRPELRLEPAADGHRADLRAALEGEQVVGQPHLDLLRGEAAAGHQHVAAQIGDRAVHHHVVFVGRAALLERKGHAAVEPDTPVGQRHRPARLGQEAERLLVEQRERGGDRAVGPELDLGRGGLDRGVGHDEDGPRQIDAPPPAGR